MRRHNLTCGVVVADSEDGTSAAIRATGRMLKIRVPLRIAVLRGGLIGRGAVVRIAADGGCVAPDDLAEMAPTVELGLAWVFLPVR